MDDRRAHFLTMLGDACAAAGAGSIAMEVLLADGRRLGGMPSSSPVSELGVDESGYASPMVIDGNPVDVEDVVQFAVRAP